MNLVQKKYLIKRIEEITDEKLLLIKSKLIQEKVEITYLDAIELIITKKVKIKLTKKELAETIEDSVGRYYSTKDIHKIFDFSKYLKREKWDIETTNKRRKILQEESTKIKDIIMLGNSEKALKMIKKFQDKKF